MNGTNVIEITKPDFVIGIIPCQNRFFLDRVWPVISPAVDDLASASLEEWTAFRVWREIFAGTMHLYMAYVNNQTLITPEKFQEEFFGKLKDPAREFAGFMLLQIHLGNETAAHIFAVHIQPEYRQSNLLVNGMKFIEREIRNMKAKYISLSTRGEYSEAMRRFGFQETTVNFRKKLS